MEVLARRKVSQRVGDLVVLHHLWGTSGTCEALASDRDFAMTDPFLPEVKYITDGSLMSGLEPVY